MAVADTRDGEPVGRRIASASIRRRAAGAFVGRTDELDRLVPCLEGRTADRHLGAVIEGEPGIGKSRLVTEALARAGRRPEVLRGRADELQRGRPFGAILDALGALRGDEYDARLADLLSGTASGDVPVAGPGLRGQIVDACAAAVRARARHHPVVLVVEDLQWADAGTLAVLGEVAESGHSEAPRLVLTLRGGPRPRGLERLLAHLVPRVAMHLPLTGLAIADVDELVLELLGERHGPQLGDHVRRAAGNPLFVVELLDALADQGSLVAAPGVDATWIDVEHSTLPPSLRITLLRRLSTLPVAALETLRVAALLGTTFSVDDLGVVLEESPLQVLKLLREPMRTGWIESAGPRLSFRHDLVREALTADTPEAVRRTLHRQAARRLAAEGRDSTEVATHLLLGAQPPDPDAAALLREAGHHAISREPAVAIELLEGAIRLDEDRTDRAATELDLGLARLWAGHVDEGEATLRGLLDRVRGAPLEVEVGLALARSCLLSGATGESVLVLTDVAGRTTDPLQRLRVDAERALAHVYRGELDDAARAADAVLDGQGPRHDEARCLAGGVRASLLAIDGHLERAAEEAREAVSVASRSADREVSRIPPQLFLGSVLIDSDRFDEGWQQLAAARRISEGLGTVWVEPVQHLISARAHLLSGALDDVEAECETALRLADDAGVRVMEAWGHAMIALVRIHRLELERARAALAEGERAVARSGHQVRGVDWLLWARARLAAAEGDPSAARALLGAVWAAHHELGMRSERRLLGPDLVALHLWLGERGEAGTVTEAVAEAAEVMGTASARAAALRCQGLLADDADLLLAAAALTRPSACRPEHAAHCLDAGRAQGRGGDRAQARELLEEALEVAHACRMQRTVREAEAELRQLGIRRGARGPRPRSRPALGWDALTPTELMVAQLAAEGLSNPAIGERLFVSRRTVQTHLSHVYAKLGISSRVELAARAAREAGPA